MFSEETLTKAFESAGIRFSEIEKTLVNLQDFHEALAKQQKLFLNTGSRYKEDGSYKRLWPNEEMAKEFGELIVKVSREKAMTEGSGIEGGFVVPDELQARIIDLMGRFGKFRKNATVLLVGGAESFVPKIDTDLTVYSPGEGGTITKSDMKFSQIGLRARKLACLTAFSSELEEDAIIGLGEIIGLSMSRSLAKKEDKIGFVGDGTQANYFGMTGITGALLKVDSVIADIAGLIVASGNAYSEITLGDFDKLVAILPEHFDEGAKWYMSKKFYYNVVYPLARTAGVANIFEILSDRKSKYFMGYEVEFTPAMPSTEANSQICALLGDLQFGTYLAERRSLTLARSPEVYFATDEIGIRAVERMTVNAFGVGDKTNPGPIVGLITAAS